MRYHKLTAVASAVPSGHVPSALGSDALGTAHTTAKRTGGFTLAELLVTTGVLVLLVFLASQLFNSAATITTLGHKQMDADAQARQLLDRMAVDFAQMIKRSDVDYYLKSSATSPLRSVAFQGNDIIAFYSGVPGYFPTSNHKSPVSVVAYRVNSNSTSFSYNKMERMGKGLLWNGAPSPTPGTSSPTPTPVGTPSPPPTPSPTPTPVNFTPTVFIPVPLASSPLPSPENAISPAPNPWPTPAWPETSSATISWSDSEIIGPQVFRFEYYYLLKDGNFSDIPWVTLTGTNNSVNGMQDVAAIVVDIAVIDPKSRVLLGATEAQINAQLATFSTFGNANFLVDFASGHAPGWLRTQWQNTINGITSLPRPALSGIRVYERFIYLSPPVR